MNRLITIIGIYMLTLPIAANAGLILSPITVLDSPAGTINAGTTIDQSGLSAGFVSGVTDFATYIGTNPTHAIPGPLNASSTPVDNLPGAFEFDLGGLFDIYDVALWNSFQGFGINSFDIFTATDVLFTTAINVGSFTAVDTFAPMPVQVFSLTPSVGQFVRLNIYSNNGAGAVNLSEIAFDVHAVPEPGTLALLGIGLAGIGLARRRRRKV